MELDISTEKWNKIAGNLESVCSDNWNREKEGAIKIIERIGSESTQAEVYKLQIGDMVVAGKILPIISEHSFSDNIREIEIAKQVSKEVVSKKTIYFPIVYSSSYCNKTIYNKKSLFYEDSFKYALYEWICKGVFNTACQKRIKYANKNLNIQELITKYPDFPGNIESHVLISELCFSDLRQYISSDYSKNADDNFWLKVIFHVLKGIEYLNENMNILHNDLHTGNILLKIADVESERIFIPLIHDFGKSRKIESWNRDEKLFDVQKFLYDMSINEGLPFTIRQKCTFAIDTYDSISEMLDYFSEGF